MNPFFCEPEKPQAERCKLSLLGPDRGKGLEVMTVRSQRGIHRSVLVRADEKARQFDNVIISIDIVEINAKLLLTMDYESALIKTFNCSAARRRRPIG
jgi:hypothetical protein